MVDEIEFMIMDADDDGGRSGQVSDWRELDESELLNLLDKRYTRIAELEGKLDAAVEVIDAGISVQRWWDSLPVGNYSPKKVINWLTAGKYRFACLREALKHLEESK